MPDASVVDWVREKYERLLPAMNERMRRRWAATEALSLGWGHDGGACDGPDPQDDSLRDPSVEGGGGRPEPGASGGSNPAWRGRSQADDPHATEARGGAGRAGRADGRAAIPSRHGVGPASVRAAWARHCGGKGSACVTGRWRHGSRRRTTVFSRAAAATRSSRFRPPPSPD
jgi:hypothetical protein